MKVKVKKVLDKKLLLSTSDQGELFNSYYFASDMQFRPAELDYLDRLTNLSLKNQIIEQLQNLKKTSFGDYQSQEGLELFYKTTNDKILVISAGEANRDRFALYIEGLWCINNS